MPSISHSLLSYLRAVAGAWCDDPRENAELLARFTDKGDETAFKALVYRHGPLVWRSCTRVLGDGPDAEDAFQTTFLALAQKAGRLRGETLVGWLHQVARQAALRVDLEARRRRNLEHHLRAVAPFKETALDCAELYAALDEELAILPERLRIPLVLRYLENKTLEEAAHIVGCCRRVLGRRLARGQALLRRRLERRGLVVGIGTVAMLLGGTTRAPAVPTRLIGSTARAAMAFREGILTGRAAEAAWAVLRSLPLEKAIMRRSLWLVLACVCSLGVGLAAWQASPARSDAVESPEWSTSPQANAERGGARLDRDGDPLPFGALTRLGTLRLRHVGNFSNSGPNSVVFSRDGKVLITAGPGNPIRLWDTATGKLLRSFGNNPQHWRGSFALSPDGNTLAACNITSVSLWQVATGKLLRQLESATGIGTLAFSRDGRTLLSAGSDKPPPTWPRGKEWVQTRLRVWEVATGKQVRDRPLRNAEKACGFSTFIFSPDSKILASLHQGNAVSLWETATGKELYHLTVGNVRFQGERPPGAAAFSSDNRFLVVSNFFNSNSAADHRNDGAVHLLEVSTGKEVRKWTPDKMGTYSVAFSPDGKILATGSAFGSIRLWEAVTGKELRQCQGYQAHVVALAFSSDGSTLASLAGKNDHTARLWEVASGKERTRTSGGHVGPVLSLAFSSDGKSLISGDRDGLVGFWDAQTGQEQRPFFRAGDFQALAALSPDGKTFLTVGNSFTPKGQQDLEVALHTPTQVCVWDRTTGQKLRQFPGPEEGVVQSLVLSPDGKTLVLSFFRSVYLMEVATGKMIRQFTDAPGHSHCVAFSPDGKTLALALRKNEYNVVHFYATDTGKDLGDIRSPIFVGCLAFSPNGRTLAIGNGEPLAIEGCTPRIDLWQVRQDKSWKEAGKLVGQKGNIWALTFSPDGKTLASAGRDSTVRLWEVATGKERRRFAGHGGEIWCLAFGPDGRRLAAGSNDTTTLVWDVTGRIQGGQLRAAKLSAQEVKSLWADLADVDAVRAGQAIWILASAPSQALPLLREHLRPVAPVEQRIVRLIADLDSNTFAVRQKATDELEKLGETAELALRQALAKPVSLEMRRRLQELLEPLEKGRFFLSGEELRSLRALEVLGQMGTPEALRLLEELAQGAPEVQQTLQAQTTLKWLRTQVKATQP